MEASLELMASRLPLITIHLIQQLTEIIVLGDQRITRDENVTRNSNNVHQDIVQNVLQLPSLPRPRLIHQRMAAGSVRANIGCQSVPSVPRTNVGS